MNAPNPTRQVTLVGEARARRDFSQAHLPVTEELGRTLQSKADDITVRGHADGTGEDAGEVKRATPRYFCELCDFYRPIEMGDDMVFQALEHFLAQGAPRFRLSTADVWRETRLPMKPLATSFQKSDPFG